MNEEQKMNEKEKETSREIYLEDFKRHNQVSDWFSDKSQEVGKRLVEIMKKEDLTHDEAYASLQFAYNLIKYESNFLKLN